MMYKISVLKQTDIPIPEYEDKEVDLTTLHKLYLDVSSDRQEFEMYKTPLSLRLKTLYQIYLEDYDHPYLKYAMRPYERAAYFEPIETPFALFDTAREPTLTEFNHFFFEELLDTCYNMCSAAFVDEVPILIRPRIYLPNHL